MKQSIVIKRLTAGSLFKLLAVGILPSLIVYCAIMGIFALFGASTVHFNGKFLTGIEGLCVSLIIGVCIALISTLFGWIVFAVSFWLFSWFGSLEISYISSARSDGGAEKESGHDLWV